MAEEYFKEINLDNNIDPFDFLGARATKEAYQPDVYFSNELYSKISHSIFENQITIIIGNPLSGKTRVAFETFKKMKSGIVIIPNLDKSINEYRLPQNSNNQIVFLDDIDDYCYNKDHPALNKLLYYIIRKEIKCVITCRTGPEFDVFKKYIHRKYFTPLTRNKFHIPRLDKKTNDFKEFLNNNTENLKSDLNSFDGNIGSIFLPLDEYFYVAKMKVILNHTLNLVFDFSTLWTMDLRRT